MYGLLFGLVRFKILKRAYFGAQRVLCRAIHRSAFQFAHACQLPESRTADVTLHSPYFPEISRPEVSKSRFSQTRLLELQVKRARCLDLSLFQLQIYLALQRRDTRFALIRDSKPPNLESYLPLAPRIARIGDVHHPTFPMMGNLSQKCCSR